MYSKLHALRRVEDICSVGEIHTRWTSSCLVNCCCKDFFRWKHPVTSTSPVAFLTRDYKRNHVRDREEIVEQTRDHFSYRKIVCWFSCGTKHFDRRAKLDPPSPHGARANHFLASIPFTNERVLVAISVWKYWLCSNHTRLRIVQTNQPTQATRRLKLILLLLQNGCSVRLKNPQAFSKPVWQLCATLQEFFKSMVGANMWVTAAGPACIVLPLWRNKALFNISKKRFFWIRLLSSQLLLI